MVTFPLACVDLQPSCIADFLNPIKIRFIHFQAVHFFSGIWSPRNLLRTDCCGSWYLTIWLHAFGRRLAWNHGRVWWVAWHQALTASLEYGRCRMSWQHIWLYALINGYGLIALCVRTVDVSIEHENHSNGSFCCDILWPLDHFDLHQNYPQKSYDPKIKRNAMYGL